MIGVLGLFSNSPDCVCFGQFETNCLIVDWHKYAVFYVIAKNE